MKLIKIIFGLLVAAGIAWGVWKLLNSPSRTAPDDEAAGGDNVTNIVSVQVSPLKRQTLHQFVSVYGTVEPAPATATEPAADAPLAAASAGVLASVNVAVGQEVHTGDVLLTLNSATTTAENAEQVLDRQKQLYADHNTSLKNLQDAEAQVALLRITTPLSGTVVSVNVKPGAAVDPSKPVAEVMDLDRLVVRTGVPQAEAGALQTGETVQVQAETPVEATLSFVSPTVEPGDGTVSAWAALPAGSGLRPGQMVPLQIVTAVHTNCLAAPEASVVADDDGNNVISLVHDRQATQTPVQAGFRENGWVEITGAGLKEGDMVVTVGAYGLADKTQVQVVTPPSDDTAATNADSSPAK